MEDGAFLAAAEQHRDRIFRLALHCCGNLQDAEDATQEVLLRLYLNQKPLNGEEHLRRWLLRVTVNVCRDMLRSPWRRRQVPMEEVPMAPVSFSLPEQEELYRAVLELPEKYRTVLELFYFEDLSVGEIAGLLRLTQTAVTTRLHRARKQLKNRLGEAWADDK